MVEQALSLDDEMDVKRWRFAVIPNGTDRDYSRAIDAEGCKIGVEENFILAIGNVFNNIGIYSEGKDKNFKALSRAVDYYKVIRFCYGFDTSGWDQEINKYLIDLVSPAKCSRV